MHRETPLDFWLTIATVVSLFVPVWGVLLAPTEMVAIPKYLLSVGGAALLVVVGALVYGRMRNRVLLNRFLTGYLGGLVGAGIIHVFVILGVLLGMMPNLVYQLGNVALGHGLRDTPGAGVLAVGMIYHYLLNGAAWGAAYGLLLGKVRWWYGLFFGVGVWAVLTVSPAFYALSFPARAHSFGAVVLLGMLVAHLIYGSAIGYCVYRLAFPEVGTEGSKAVRPAYA